VLPPLVTSGAAILKMRFSTGIMDPGKSQMVLAVKLALLLMVLFGAATPMRKSGSRETDLTPNGKDKMPDSPRSQPEAEMKPLVFLEMVELGLVTTTSGEEFLRWDYWTSALGTTDTHGLLTTLDKSTNTGLLMVVWVVWEACLESAWEWEQECPCTITHIMVVLSISQ